MYEVRVGIIFVQLLYFLFTLQLVFIIQSEVISRAVIN